MSARLCFAPLLLLVSAACSPTIDEWADAYTEGKAAEICAEPHFSSCFVWSKERCEHEANHYIRRCAVHQTQDLEGDTVPMFKRSGFEADATQCVLQDLNTVGAFFVKKDDQACVDAIFEAAPPERHKNMRPNMEKGPEGWPKQ